MTAAIPLPHRPPGSRRGYTLIEALLAVTAGSLVMGGGICLLVSMLQAQGRCRTEFNFAQQVERLSAQFRRDLVEARQIQLASPSAQDPTSTTSLLLTLQTPPWTLAPAPQPPRSGAAGDPEKNAAAGVAPAAQNAARPTAHEAPLVEVRYLRHPRGVLREATRTTSGAAPQQTTSRELYELPAECGVFITANKWEQGRLLRMTLDMLTLESRATSDAPMPEAVEAQAVKQSQIPDRVVRLVIEAATTARFDVAPAEAQ